MWRWTYSADVVCSALSFQRLERDCESCEFNEVADVLSRAQLCEERKKGIELDHLVVKFLQWGDLEMSFNETMDAK